MRFILLVSVFTLTFSGSAKVIFKLSEGPKYALMWDPWDFCNGGSLLDKSAEDVSWDLGETVAPNASEKEKNELIDNYRACFTFGLQFYADKFFDATTFTLMIPQGLFITDADGSYDENMNFSGKKEAKTNFKNFVVFARPYFEKYFTDLRVYVWQWGW